MNLEKIYLEVDDFCKEFMPAFEKSLICGKEKTRLRATRLSMSELVAILILFHSSNYRSLKHFYYYLLTHHRAAFPGLVSYERFVHLIPRALIPLTAFLQSSMGKCTGISFIDSTSISVCKPKRMSSHKVFKGIAKKGKTTIGWFFGFKCHVVVNELGELLAAKFTAGNVDDRRPVPGLTKKLAGKLFGDKGYISAKLFKELYEKGINFYTGIKSNMKNQLVPVIDKLLLRKRSIIETIFDQLKNVAQIEHSRHRSPTNFLVHVTAALTAYSLKPKKPAINIDNFMPLI
jgi:hypothetical protein